MQHGAGRLPLTFTLAGDLRDRDAKEEFLSLFNTLLCHEAKDTKYSPTSVTSMT